MITAAKAVFDPSRFGVRVSIRSGNYLRTFDGGEPVAIPQDNSMISVDEENRSSLLLPEPEARALYDALAEYFGHAAGSYKVLRKDYEAERSRVDLLISHLTGK